MTVKDLPKDTHLDGILLLIPDDVEQLTDTPLKQGYIVSLHAHPPGIFLSPDAPNSKSRKLIPTYPKDRRDILEWSIISKQ